MASVKEHAPVPSRCIRGRDEGDGAAGLGGPAWTWPVAFAWDHVTGRRDDSPINRNAGSGPRGCHIVTIDFQVTSECGQECACCWASSSYERPVDTSMALQIVERIKDVAERLTIGTRSLVLGEGWRLPLGQI
jgi:hypothetical protein